MPRYQDPGHNGQHAFTAFIHSYSPFVRFSLTPHFDPAQYRKTSHSESRNRTVEGRRGRNDEAKEEEAAAEAEVVVAETMPLAADLAARVDPPTGFFGEKLESHDSNIVRTM
jgi:hypothetical protein